jgi:hypothetical protein
MGRKSPKEQCFEDALDAHNKAFPDKNPNVKLFQDWYRDLDGSWHQSGMMRSFSHWIGSILKTGRIRRQEQDPRPPGEPNPEQWRTPDITGPDGKVYDLKFTDKNGRIDPWGDKNGMGGGTQEQDQEAINRQAGSKDGAMSLDEKTCKCKERGQPKPVEVPVPSLSTAPFFMPMPAPGATVPSVPGIPPIFEPMPIPGFAIP